MYTKFHIENFRAFRQLDIDGLRRINLIVGKNNSGKTSLLEAMFLLGGATNPINLVHLAKQRGQQFDRSAPSPFLRSLFFGLGSHDPIVIEGKWEGEFGSRRLELGPLRSSLFSIQSETWSVGNGSGSDAPLGGVRLNYQPAEGEPISTEARFDGPPSEPLPVSKGNRPDTHYHHRFLSSRNLFPLSRELFTFSHLVTSKRESMVVDALRILEPSIQRLEIVSEAGGSSIYADLGLASLVPLAACGEGMIRLFSIVCELFSAGRGVLLIDEIDNGIHFNVLNKFWEQLHRLSVEHDVQIVATTHSEELLESALEVFGDEFSEFGLFRIDKVGDGHKVASYGAEALRGVVSANFEVRG